MYVKISPCINYVFVMVSAYLKHVLQNIMFSFILYLAALLYLFRLTPY